MGRFHKPNDTGAHNRWRANIARTLTRNAETTRCPKCGRKGALVRNRDAWPFVTVCRWRDCDYERG